MLKVNIAQKLQAKAAKNAQAELQEAESILDSVKDSLANDDAETQAVLEYFGTHKSIQKQQQRAIKSKRNLKGEVVSIDQVRQICLDYNLRCLSTEYYIKAVPFAALNDIKNFQDKTPEFDKRNLFIIAPKSHFQTMLVDKRDPVVLYKQGENFRVVTQFGNDFTVLRRVQGFVLSTLWIFPVIASIIGMFLVFFYSPSTQLTPLGLFAGIPFIFVLINNEYSWNWNSQPTKLV